MISHVLSISCLILGGAALQSPREDSVVPPGLEPFVPPSPALKRSTPSRQNRACWGPRRWAKFGRPSGAGFSRIACVPSLLFAVISCLILTCAASTFACAANSASGDVVLRALREEMERSKAKLKLENVPAPYYIEYRVTEIDQVEASAVFGALRSQQHDHGRLLRVVVRVGDYKQDSFFGTGEGSVDLVPSDDDVFAIRHRLWLATDRAYKAATEALSAKQAALKQLKVDQPVDDFAKATPVEAVEPLAHFASTDFTSWIHLLEEASAQYRADKELQSFESTLRFTVENR